jgi:hypothetical protein
MQIALYLSAVLCFGIGLAHSILGERYILIRLFRRNDLPKLFGGQEFTVRTLRFAWHITTVAWWGFAGILILIAEHALSSHNVLSVVATTFFVSAMITLVASNGRHLAWPVFLVIAVASVYPIYI